ncbi:MAG: FAD-dependent oxidoreductase [Leptospira sp.]|nr:FAD-dependent oxidoreductase [Leptospira sp.]
MKRKDFLKTLALSSVFGGITIPKSGFGQTSTASDSSSAKVAKKKAIVLGGGLAGLYSAYLLKTTGYEVTIVERGERLGGRIFTYENSELGIKQDLGGEWIGEGQGDIKSLIKQLGLELKNSRNSDQFSISPQGKSGIAISSASAETLNKVIELHKSLNSSQKQGLDKINFASYARYQGISEDEIRTISDVYRSLLGDDLNKISSESVLDDLSTPQSALRPKYVIAGGASGLIEGLTKRLSGEEIILNDMAIKVSQQKTQVIVDLSSGKQIKANILICSLPTHAVLEIKWTPTLPKDLVYSALRMQTGKISKNLIFCKPNDSVGQFYRVTQTPGETFYIGDESSGSQITAVTSLSTGDRAGLFEKGSLSQKSSLLKLSMEEMNGFELWNESPFQFYSFLKTTGKSGFVSLFPPGSFGIKEIWAEPFERVFFAGEHLALHTGSMDSAVSSAIQAISRT